MAFDFPATPTDGQIYSPSGGPDYVWNASVGAWEIKTSGNNSAFVAKAGDTMTGLLNLSANPTANMHAVPKQYLDAKPSIYVSDTAPVGVPDGSFWFESDTGLLYLKFNDGTSTQWVIATPQPDVSGFVVRAGDTMTGPLNVTAPTAPAHATTKNYVDTADSGLYSTKVAKAGDTMSGFLRIATPNGAVITMDPLAPLKGGYYNMERNGVRRWTMGMDESAESGGNAGSNFYITSHQDNGSMLPLAFQINRASGDVAMRNIVTIEKGPGAYETGIQTKMGGVMRWKLSLGDANAETGGNLGSNISLYRYADNGGFIDSLLTINRQSGLLQYAGAVTFNTNLFCGGNIGTTGGNITTSTGTVAGNSVQGQRMKIQPATADHAWLQFFNEGGGNTGQMIWDRNAACMSFKLVGSYGYANDVTVDAPGLVKTGNGIYCKYHQGGGYGANNFNMWWSGGAMQLCVDSTVAGTIAFTSDYRTKKDVVDLDSKWDVVKALRPVKYTQANFSVPKQIEANVKEKAAVAKLAIEEREKGSPEPKEYEERAPTFVADDIERWGFLAHELQETLTPSASSGVKDDPEIIQSPNPFTLIAALTKALQEAMARIEALEAKVA